MEDRKYDFYIGLEVVKASPMTPKEWVKLKDPNAEYDDTENDGDTPGYHVIRNTGLNYWVDKAEFERCYAKDANPHEAINNADWQVRLVGEYNSLKCRLGKLNKFFETEEYANLPEEDKHLLTQQGAAMNTLLTVLKMRYDRLPDWIKGD